MPRKDKQKKGWHYDLTWFDPVTDMAVGEEVVDVAEDEVRAWFHLTDDEPPIHCYPVTAEQKQHLEGRTGCRVDLDRYVYFIEATADGSHAVPYEPFEVSHDRP